MIRPMLFAALFLAAIGAGAAQAAEPVFDDQAYHPQLLPRGSLERMGTMKPSRQNWSCTLLSFEVHGSWWHSYSPGWRPIDVQSATPPPPGRQTCPPFASSGPG